MRSATHWTAGPARDATCTWSRAFVALLRGRPKFDAMCMPPAAPRAVKRRSGRSGPHSSPSLSEPERLASRQYAAARDRVGSELQAERGLNRVADPGVGLVGRSHAHPAPGTGLPVVEAEVERLQGYPRGGRQVGGSPFQQQRVTDAQGALGSEGDWVVAAERERRRAQVVDPEPAERGQQLEPGPAVKAGQRQALKHAGEAALRSPGGLAGEGGRLGTGALGPGAVGG